MSYCQLENHCLQLAWHQLSASCFGRGNFGYVLGGRQAQVGECSHNISQVMVVDPRISDRELATINAAAVTREYRVQPHLGMFTATCPFLSWSDTISFRLSHCICHQRVKISLKCVRISLIDHLTGRLLYWTMSR